MFLADRTRPLRLDFLADLRKDVRLLWVVSDLWRLSDVNKSSAEFKTYVPVTLWGWCLQGQMLSAGQLR